VEKSFEFSKALWLLPLRRAFSPVSGDGTTRESTDQIVIVALE